MQLVRKWNPQSSLYIDNPNGPKVYRILALIKDGVNDHYVCFYDSWTLKVYVERVVMKPGSSYFDHHSLYQVTNNKEFQDLVAFLMKDGVEVLQEVETKIENVKNEETGKKELVIHDNMNNLPRTKYGVDSNGHQSITGVSPVDIQMSPSLTDERGNPITDFSNYA